MSVDDRILSELKRGVRIWRTNAAQPGDLIPVNDLLLGRTLPEGPGAYAQLWATHMLQCPSTAGLTRLRALYRAVADFPTDGRLVALARAAERYRTPGADVAWYLAAHIAEAPEAWRRLTHAVAGRSFGNVYYNLRQLACTRQASICRPLWEVDNESLTAISYLAGAIAKFRRAETMVELDELVAAEKAREDVVEVTTSETLSECYVDDENITDGGVADMADLVDLLAEDRAEITPRAPARTAVVPASAPRPSPTVVVVPELPDPMTLPFARREIAKGFAAIAGKPLRLVTRGDVVAHRRRLEARFCYAPEVVDIMLRDLAAVEVVRLRPTILVGGAGTGKTSLARWIFTTLLGTAWTQYPGGGVADGSVAGTSAAWSSARTTTALDLIRSTGVANPGVIVDEIDKVGTSRHNGNAADALLAMIERSQAARYRDPGLEVDVDISPVNWILTANDKSAIPAPLRDRCRVIEMPTPKAYHLEPLLPGIFEDLAAERGIDARWLAPLAGDELALVRRHWKGGSIRRLKRAVEALVDTRDHGRAQ